MPPMINRSQTHSFFTFLKTHPTRFWFFLFFFINLFFAQSGASNADIRFATLCAMVEDHSFKIDAYRQTSVDWSKTPDGHYYSSKAPGPILLGFPIFWVLDSVVTHGISTRESRDLIRFKYRGTTLPLLCLILILIPFSLICAYWLQLLTNFGASNSALQLTAVALFFGNTCAFFMNCLFNHGLIATGVLCLAASLYRKKYFLVGLSFGWLVLSDYSCALILLPLLYCLYGLKARLKDYHQIAHGGLVPLLLFIGYHWVCFGGPFTLPYAYVNPEFIETNAGAHWGLISLPNFSIWIRFLIGPERGLLWTQPWLLLLLFLAPSKTWKKTETEQLLFNLFYPFFWLLILLFSFYGKWWHGGDSPGPRFICAPFAGFALLLGFYYDQMSSRLKRWLGTGVCVAALFYICVFGVLLPPDDSGPIWVWYLRRYFVNVRWVYWARLCILTAAFTVTFRKSSFQTQLSE